MIGAAYSTLFSYIWMAGLTYFIVRKWYNIPYEWNKIFIIFLSGGFVAFIFYFFSVENILLKILLIIVYFALNFGFKIVSYKKLLILVKMKKNKEIRNI